MKNDSDNTPNQGGKIRDFRFGVISFRIQAEGRKGFDI